MQSIVIINQKKDPIKQYLQHQNKGLTVLSVPLFYHVHENRMNNELCT